MAKPIFIITIPASLKDLEKYSYLVQEKLSDYHVLINCDGNLPETKYQLFSDKEIEPIELEKLKEIVNAKT